MRVFRSVLGLAKYGLLLGCIFFAVRCVRNPLYFPIRYVQVVSPFTHIQAQTFQDCIAPWTQYGFFSLNIHALEQDLQALPWVSEVSIRRVWPHTLSVLVTEKVPFAVWNQKELITKNGRLFQPHFWDDSHLPKLSGPDDGLPAVLAQYQALQARLAPHGLSIHALDYQPRKLWTLTTSCLRIQMADDPTVTQKIQRFLGYYAAFKTKHLHRFMSVDLRYPDGFAALDQHQRCLDSM